MPWDYYDFIHSLNLPRIYLKTFTFQNMSTKNSVKLKESTRCIKYAIECFYQDYDNVFLLWEKQAC